MAWAGLAWPGLRWPGWLQYGGDHPLWRHAEYQYAGRAGTGVCPGLSGVGVCFYLPAMSRRVKESLYRRQSQQANVLPGEEGRVALTPPIILRWGNSPDSTLSVWTRLVPQVRILLIIGSVRDVEHLTPKLTQELWQEDQGTLLLWGGDPGAAVDNAWFTALRKLRYRPADGMVWATSGFDGVLTTMNRAKPRLTPDEMDSVSHSLAFATKLLAGNSPLRLVAVRGGNEKKMDVSSACRLPVTTGCTPQIVAEQFPALASLLLEQGIQQICGQPHTLFLLALADQLTREAKRWWNRYR